MICCLALCFSHASKHWFKVYTISYGASLITRIPSILCMECPGQGKSLGLVSPEDEEGCAARDIHGDLKIENQDT